MTYPLFMNPAYAVHKGDLCDEAAVAFTVDTLRANPPRIHALVAGVAQPFLANIGAALSIDVSMTVDPIDVRAMVLRSDATLVNLGMLDNTRREGVLSAIATGCPFVLDPVKVERAPDRLAFAHMVLGKKPRIVKGNRSEMAALQPQDASVHVTTGKHDIVEWDGRRTILTNGDPIMDRVIATGCAAGLLITAMSCVAPDPFIAAVSGLSLMNVAGEAAAKVAKGPGTFAVELIDAVAALDGKTVAARMTCANGA